MTMEMLAKILRYDLSTVPKKVAPSVRCIGRVHTNMDPDYAPIIEPDAQNLVCQLKIPYPRVPRYSKVPCQPVLKLLPREM